MPIVISQHEHLRIHRIRFFDRVTFDELLQMSTLHGKHPEWAMSDTIHMVEEGADLSDLDETKIELMRQHYRTLHTSMEFYLVRRSLWMCRDLAACRIVEHFLHDRHSRDGQGTELLLVTDLRDGAPLFTREELDAAESKTGFLVLASIQGEGSSAAA